MRHRQQIGLALVLGALASGLPAAVTAQPKPKAGAKALDLARLQAALESGDEKRALEALSTIDGAGAAGKAAAPLVQGLLARGANAPLLGRAIEVCGGLGVESCSAPIAPYLRHRMPQVRRAAAKALIDTKGPVAVRALSAALRSPDPQVRGIAASGLGSLRAHDALPDLFKALSLKVSEAATSIGQLCKPEECEKFATLLGKQPFDVMTSGFEQILFRPSAEMPDDQKIRIVGRLRELGTKDAGNYLAEVASRWPANGSKRVKQAIDGAVKALGGKASSEDDE